MTKKGSCYMNPTETNNMETSEESIDLFDSIPSEEGYSGISEAVPESTQAETPTKQVNEPVVNDGIDEFEQLIASDPLLAEEYLAKKYGVASEPQEQPRQAPVQQQEQVKPVINELPFAPEEYDPMNVQHQQAIVQQTIAQALEPALDYINHLKEQEAYEYQQVHYQKLQQDENDLRAEMDRLASGFGELVAKKDPSIQEAAIVEATFKRFEATMRKFDSDKWEDPDLQKKVLRLIAPDVKQSIEALNKPQGKSKTQLQEDYVEPSSAVPAGSPNAFERAFQAGDSDAMFDAVMNKL